MAIIKLQKQPIDVKEYYQQLKDPAHGGIVTFCGTIREWTGEVHTTQIVYTAYEEMAIKEMEKLAHEVEKLGSRVIIVHRLGALAVEDEAVFIGVASPHRKAAFEGCEYIIDHLKQTVPIWKKEIDTDKIRWGGSSSESFS
ncbi:molybdenum cofactor biosynthesis protein MoaE [Enterococcus sp. AZ109]|uniref:molybdenum cofactor biosynthesis protein MoaE n=1 Tax=Enterococcus sp. AZ109 TaxID=2774634 RepID=UPI003F1ECE68